MKKNLILLFLGCFSLTLIGADQAEARRFGGGASFGKQRMIQPHMQQRQAPATASKSASPSPRSGMLGALGGLAMGGLLGSLLFGGAFEGIKLFDVLVVGGMIALLVLLFRRHAATQPVYAGGPAPGGGRDAPSGQGKLLRPNIDEAHFLEAARNIYLRMQKDWDAGDLEDIRRFCTPDIAQRIAAEMQRGHGHQTEVGLLEASIADAWIEQDAEWVSVHFRAMLREKTLDEQGRATEDTTAEVNEIWHFRHQPGSDDPTWYLAGIQQLDRSP